MVELHAEPAVNRRRTAFATARSSRARSRGSPRRRSGASPVPAGPLPAWPVRRLRCAALTSLVEPLHFGDRIGLRARRGRACCFQPTSNMPNCVPQSPMWLSVMTRWPSSRSVRARQSPRIVERMWPTCIGLATFGELKSMTTVRGWRGLAQKTDVRRARRLAGVCASAGGLSRKFRKPAPAISTFSHTFAHVELGEHVGGELARVQLPRLGQRHQRVGLVVAELRVGARADQDGGDVRVRQDGARRPAAGAVRFVCAAARLKELMVERVERLQAVADGYRCNRCNLQRRNRLLLPCSLMMLSMASASGACSSAWRNSALWRSLAMLASVWRCF